MKKLLFGVILIGAIAGVAFVWLGNQQPAVQLPPKTEKVLRGDIVEKVGTMGKIAPKDVVIVGIDVPVARINEVYPGIEVNKKVKKDQPLFRLDDTLVLAKLKEAEAALAAAEAAKKEAESKKDSALANVNRAQIALDMANDSLKRAQKISEQNPGEVTKAKLDEARDQVKVIQEGVTTANASVKQAEAGILAADAMIFRAKAGVDVAQKGVEVMTVKAPIAGVILEKDRRVMAGQVVSAQMSPLFVIAPEPLEWEIYAQVGEYDIIKIKKGMPVQFTVDAYSDDNSAKFTGKVSRIADLPTNPAKTGDLPAGTTGPVLFTVTVDVLPEKTNGNNSTHPLLAGLSANVDFSIKVKKNALTIPNAALNYRPENLSGELQKKIEERTASEPNLAPVFVWLNKEEKLVFVRKLATDGNRTAVEPADDFKLEEKMDVITEGPPPPEKRGIFEKPIKGVGLN